MNVVELLERLRAQGIELVWYDRAGPVWSGGLPPEEARAWVDQLAPALEYAVRGAGSGHVWGCCSACGVAQLVPKAKLEGRRCHSTPRCDGTVGRWVELETARQAWEALKAARRLAVAQAKAAEAKSAATGGLLGLPRPPRGSDGPTEGPAR